MTEQLIGKLGYLGIALILILGGLGLPIPEEAPIIVAAVLSPQWNAELAAGDRELPGLASWSATWWSIFLGYLLR